MANREERIAAVARTIGLVLEDPELIVKVARLAVDELDAVDSAFRTDGMRDVSAKCIPVQVVSAKLPGEWIIRAIGPFRDVPTLRSWIEPFTKMAPRDAVIEWTFHEYRIPAYIIYGYGQVEGLGWPEPGVWIFRRSGEPPEDHAAERFARYDDAEWLRGPS